MTDKDKMPDEIWAMPDSDWDPSVDIAARREKKYDHMVRYIRADLTPTIPDDKEVAAAEKDLGEMTLIQHGDKKWLRGTLSYKTYETLINHIRSRHADDNTIKQGSMIYNPHHYEVVEKRHAPSSEGVEITPQQFISLLLGGDIKFNATTTHVELPYTEVRKVCEIIRAAQSSMEKK